MTLAARPRDLVSAGRVAGIDAQALATRYGTPQFVYDLDAVSARVDALRSALPASFDLAFAVKANPLLAVLQHLEALDLGADVASGGELRHVLRAGFDPSRVVLTGPGKRDDELAAAVDAGIRVVTVESRGELCRLATIAEAAGRVQPVLLRRSAAARRTWPGHDSSRRPGSRRTSTFRHRTSRPVRDLRPGLDSGHRPVYSPGV